MMEMETERGDRGGEGETKMNVKRWMRRKRDGNKDKCGKVGQGW